MATLDGKNRNPILLKVECNNSTSFMSERLKAELDTNMEDEIDHLEGKLLSATIKIPQ